MTSSVPDPNPNPNPNPGRMPVAERVVLWDAASSAVRSLFRERGFREVSTPVRVVANAVEPFIEPVIVPGGFLQTSPELSMKRLLAQGSGPIFQIAVVTRQGEQSPHHREEFHLIEWYRDTPDSDLLAGDIEALVATVFGAVRDVMKPDKRERAVQRQPAPTAWDRVELLARMRETPGFDFAGNEPADTLNHAISDVRRRLGLTLPMREPNTQDARDLAAWTELHSAWTDLEWTPFLRERDGSTAVHLAGFPAALAALAELEPTGRTARRFESYVGTTELANAYVELRDPDAQRRRFDAVNELRRAQGLPALPIDESFLAALPGLPPCAGAAMGFERLLMVASGATDIAEVELAPGGSTCSITTSSTKAPTTRDASD